eukprot:SAG25_NODE_331_length_9668_cov_3.863518_2_plen_39_part_00
MDDTFAALGVGLDVEVDETPGFLNRREGALSSQQLLQQ